MELGGKDMCREKKMETGMVKTITEGQRDKENVGRYKEMEMEK